MVAFFWASVITGLDCWTGLLDWTLLCVYSVDVMSRPSSPIVLDSGSGIESEGSVLSSTVKVALTCIITDP